MSTQFRPDAGPIVVQAELRGPAGDAIARFVLDTGAVCSMVNPDIAELLGYDPGHMADTVEITTASGVETVPRFRMQQVRALGRERRDLLFTCHALPPSATAQGLPGLDFFRGLRLVVDFREGQVTLD